MYAVQLRRSSNSKTLYNVTFFSTLMGNKLIKATCNNDVGVTHRCEIDILVSLIQRVSKPHIIICEIYLYNVYNFE